MIEAISLLWEAEVRSRSMRKGDAPFGDTLVFQQARVPPNGASPTGFTVRDLPASERPRERMAALGAEALSQQELLACVLGSGVAGESVLVTAQRCLSRFGSIQGIAQASLEELAQVRGIGLAKARQLKAACEFSRRMQMASLAVGNPIETAEAAMAAARAHVAGKTKEHFILLLLDARHRLMKMAEVSVGSLDASIVHPRETFRAAISAGAAAIILAHNHPSGDPAPSAEDLALTWRLVEGGRLLGIPVLDHVIIGAQRSISLKNIGQWPSDAADA